MTAVEWLVKELGITDLVTSENMPITNKIFEAAKEMEKQQIIDAQSYAVSHADMTNNKGYFDCEKYYNETYNLSQQDKP